MTIRKRSINLALQGGGSHGAFTWGALHRLLDHPELAIEAISGSSSGAMNAVILAQGWLDGGSAGAQAALAEFWNRVGRQFGAAFGHGHGAGQRGSSMPTVMDAYLRMARDFSPYVLNPLGHNPLRQTLDQLVDFVKLRRHSTLQLFIGATQVRTGKLRIFSTAELSTDVLLASACLPSLHHAVIIDGEPYWDGGFTGNPPVFPLLFECRGKDVLIIVIQPLQRTGVPVTAEEIRNRSQELSFNSTFLREMRAIAMSKQRIGGWWPRGDLESRIEQLNFHVLQDAAMDDRLDARSRMVGQRDFIRCLFDQGHAAADDWLQRNFEHIGVRSTIDLAEAFV